MTSPESYLVVSTSTPSREIARALADILLEQHLAASVQILGLMESHYWWQDERRRTDEYLCIIKTRVALYDKVEAVIRAHHPYVIPEIIATPMAHGSRDFLSWIARYTDS